MSTSKPIRSQAQIAASRANGAQSKGPVTEEGKAIVSMNRMTHGFRSNSITLSNEDHVAYDQHLDAYLTRYNPIDKTEEDLVGLLASSMWQIMRNNSIELSLFELEIAGVVASEEAKYEGMDEYGLLALAFKKSAGDNALELLRRYKSTAERSYHRALQALEQLKGDQIKADRTRCADPKPQQPAPSPIPREDLFAVQTQEEPTPEPTPNRCPECQQNRSPLGAGPQELDQLPCDSPREPGATEA
jgi:hypothetical protein